MNLSKTKNIFKIIVAISLVLVTIFSFSSCAKSEDLREQAVDMLDAILQNDVEAAYDLMYEKADKDDFEDDFKYLVTILDGVTEYKLTQTSYYTGIENFKSTTEITYNMETNNGNFIVKIATCKQYEGIYRFYVEPVYPAATVG